MEQIRYPETTNRLRSSRLIKIGLIGIMALLGIQILDLGLLFLVMHMISTGKFDMTEAAGQAQAVMKMLDILDRESVKGGIAAIVTALIARYGLRETSGNIASGLNRGDSEIQK